MLGSKDVSRDATRVDRPAPPQGHHRGPAARHEPRRPRSHRRRHRDADRHRHARRAGALQLGVLRLPADVDRLGADLGPALGSLRPPAAVPRRHRRVRRRIGAVRRGDLDDAIDRVPRHPGNRRRRGHPAQHDDHRRAVRARGARTRAGVVQRRVGRRVDCRTAGRRLYHRRAVVALGVLPEPAVRRPGRDRDCAGVSAALGDLEGAGSTGSARRCCSGASPACSSRSAT